jgi:prepilin-type N-terminal cleavage/methylation domain-containing protein
MNKHKGFTLLEISIVLALTAILALGVLPDLGNYTAKQELKLSAAELLGHHRVQIQGVIHPERANRIRLHCFGPRPPMARMHKVV